MGNLHLRFDEGRVGRATGVALSPTLPASMRRLVGVKRIVFGPVNRNTGVPTNGMRKLLQHFPFRGKVLFFGRLTILSIPDQREAQSMQLPDRLPRRLALLPSALLMERLAPVQVGVLNINGCCDLGNRT